MYLARNYVPYNNNNNLGGRAELAFEPQPLGASNGQPVHKSVLK